MKLVTFSATDGKLRPGALLEDANLVVDLSDAGYADTLAVIAAGVTTIGDFSAYPGYNLSGVGCTPRSPIPRASLPLG